ncbi:unnamed protein product [Diamesa serratosioi]
MYDLFEPICLGIAKFYESTIEFARLQFILKDAPTVRTVYSIDFTRENTLFHENYKNNFGLMVKFNADQSYNETLIIVNKTSISESISECFLGALNDIEFHKLALKMMEAEKTFDVIRILSMKKILTRLVKYSFRQCGPDFSVDTIFEKLFKQPKIQQEKEALEETMKCVRKFITEEQVEGVTFFRINLDIQSDDKSCEKINKYITDSHDTTEEQGPEEACMKRIIKNINYVKREMSINFLSELDFSVQQKAEAKLQHAQLSKDEKQFFYGCQIEVFNAI